SAHGCHQRAAAGGIGTVPIPLPAPLIHWRLRPIPPDARRATNRRRVCSNLQKFFLKLSRALPPTTVYFSEVARPSRRAGSDGRKEYHENETDCGLHGNGGWFQRRCFQRSCAARNLSFRGNTGGS